MTTSSNSYKDRRYEQNPALDKKANIVKVEKVKNQKFVSSEQKVQRNVKTGQPVNQPRSKGGNRVIVAGHPDIGQEEAEKLLNITKDYGRINLTPIKSEAGETTGYNVSASKVVPQEKPTPSVLVTKEQRLQNIYSQTQGTPGIQKVEYQFTREDTGIALPGGAAGFWTRLGYNIRQNEKSFVRELTGKNEPSKVAQIGFDVGTYFLPGYGEVKFASDIGGAAESKKYGEAILLGSIPYAGLGALKVYEAYRTSRILKNAKVTGEPSFVTERFTLESGEVVERSIGIIPVSYKSRSFNVKVASEGVSRESMLFGEKSIIGSDISKINVFEITKRGTKSRGSGDFKSAYELIGVDETSTFGRVDYLSNLGAKKEGFVVQGKAILFGEPLFSEGGENIGQKIFMRGFESKQGRGSVSDLLFLKRPKFRTGFLETGTSQKVATRGESIEYFPINDLLNVGIRVPKSEVFFYQGKNVLFGKKGLKIKEEPVDKDFFYLFGEKARAKSKAESFEYLKIKPSEAKAEKPVSGDLVSEQVTKVNQISVQSPLSKRYAKASVESVLKSEVKIPSGKARLFLVSEEKTSEASRLDRSVFSGIGSVYGSKNDSKYLNISKSSQLLLPRQKSRVEEGLKHEQALRLEQDLKLEQGLKYEQVLLGKIGFGRPTNVTPSVKFPNIPSFVLPHKGRELGVKKKKKSLIFKRLGKGSVYVLPDLASVSVTEMENFRRFGGGEAVAPRVTKDIYNKALLSFKGMSTGFIPTEQMRTKRILI